MLTRRGAIGTGLASMALAAIGTRAHAEVATTGSIVLVEPSMVAAHKLKDGLRAIGMAAPVREIVLDAQGYAQFKADIAMPGGIIGVTSETMKFCLGEIAADHGYRLVDTQPFCLAERPASSSDGRTASVMRALHASQAISNPDAAMQVWTLLKTARGPLDGKARAA